ncbi:hypothetical protein B0H13DRAFT_1888523 [Mycena leptocephala]|nr:hypothetical protein B0H13DRAFT_1888523 [Mycena leptocephala]
MGPGAVPGRAGWYIGNKTFLKRSAIPGATKRGSVADEAIISAQATASTSRSSHSPESSEVGAVEDSVPRMTNSWALFSLRCPQSAILLWPLLIYILIPDERGSNKSKGKSLVIPRRHPIFVNAGVTPTEAEELITTQLLHVSSIEYHFADSFISDFPTALAICLHEADYITLLTTSALGAFGAFRDKSDLVRIFKNVVTIHLPVSIRNMASCARVSGNFEGARESHRGHIVIIVWCLESTFISYKQTLRQFKLIH